MTRWRLIGLAVLVVAVLVVAAGGAAAVFLSWVLDAADRYEEEMNE